MIPNPVLETLNQIAQFNHELPVIKFYVNINVITDPT